MNKEDSTLLKGVSILMMLYWHLFYNPINVDCCNNCLEIDGMPLALLLSRATNPVPFFVILSGYGIYIQSLKREIKVNKKLWKLYSMYWLSCAVFVPIGYWLIGLDRYPGNIIDIISNLSGWKPTWNGEVWFLFPYVVVSLLLSKYLLRIRWNPVVVLLVAFLVGICGQYLVSRFGASFLYSHRLWHMPIICLNFLFPFMLGVYMAKFKIIEFFEENVRGGHFLWLLIIMLIVVRCLFHTGAFHTLYAAAFIVLFCLAPKPSFMKRFCLICGENSTMMWFCHTYFCYYLFHDFIYSFKYPVAIFTVLLVCSLISASLLNTLYKSIISTH